ncbi:MAG: cation:proton antiporter [Rhodospirillales bacterium]|nr:cation:proton antiporter [Rhodospirillales bacterium]
MVEGTSGWVQPALVFLGVVAAVQPVAARLRVSPILGYLLAGMALGPHGLARVAEPGSVLGWLVVGDTAEVSALAELGVVFLLFMIGLELSPERLMALRRLVFGLGAAQVAISAAVIGAFAFAFGNPVPAALLLGACLSLSSTAIVMQVLAERRETGTRMGRGAFAILLFQDLAVVPILFALGIASGNGEATAGALALAFAKAAVAVAAILAAGRYAMRPLLREAAISRRPELFMGVCLLVVVGTAAVTGAAGLSMALGAFLAGAMLAESEYRHEIEILLEPFKGLLLALFFLSVGLDIDAGAIAGNAGWIFASAVGLLAIKGAIVFALARAFGFAPHAAVQMGLLLGHGGEFAFLVVGMALAAGLLPADTAQFMLLVVGLSMLAVPFLARIGGRIAAAAPADSPGADGGGPRERHVVILGFGRVGRQLARILDAESVPFVALDADAKTVTQARAEGLHIHFGDAANADTLARLGAGEALALVVTLDSPAAAERAIAAARRDWPDLPVLARARDAAHAGRLRAAGAAAAIPETLEASLQIATRTLEIAGGLAEEVAARIERERAQSLAEIDSGKTGGSGSGIS